jgi:hypothetical protein
MVPLITNLAFNLIISKFPVAIRADGILIRGCIMLVIWGCVLLVGRHLGFHWHYNKAQTSLSECPKAQKQPRERGKMPSW